MPTKKLYAIGFKNWVEIRAAVKPPRGEISRAIKPGVKEKQLIGYHVVGEYPRIQIEPDYTEYDGTVSIKTIAYIGGTVVEAIPRRRFSYAIGRSVSNGQRYELKQRDIVKLVGLYPKLLKYMPVTEPPIQVDGTVGG